MIRLTLLLTLLIIGCTPTGSNTIREPVTRGDTSIELFKACRDMCAGKVNHYAIFEGRCQCKGDK